VSDPRSWHVIEDAQRFSYADYETACRRPGYQGTERYLSILAPIFKGRKRVLDIGCGQGIFLRLLRAQGVPGVGVDADDAVLSLAREEGLSVVRDDAIGYLRANKGAYDSLFCSHVIEHLPFEQVVDLLEAACRCLPAGGLFVLVFPNPASLRMQLNYFWRDPTHVRFYQRDLIVAVLAHYGLAIDPRFPQAASWGWESLADAIPPRDGWNRLKRAVRSWLRRQLEIDGALLNQPEDALIVARKRDA